MFGAASGDDQARGWLIAILAGMIVLPGGIAFYHSGSGVLDAASPTSEDEDEAVAEPASSDDGDGGSSSTTDDDCSQRWEPDPAWAQARGASEAFLLRDVPGQEKGDSVTRASVNQSGVGADRDNATMANYTLEGSGAFDTLASFQVANSTANAAIEDDTGYGVSHQDSQVVLTDVSLLDGLIEADKIEPHARTNATTSAATYTSEGTQFSGLVVDGEEITHVSPWQMVDLSDEFGPGSRVMLYERIGSIHAPQKPVDDGWAADLDVNAIHIYLHDVDDSTSEAETLDLIVGRASGHSDFPMEPPCGPVQHVTASATALNATVPPTQPLETGHAEIPFTGGNESTQLANASLVSNNASAIDTRTRGAWEDDRSWAHAETTAADICLVPQGDSCLVEAEAVDVQTRSVAPRGEAAFSEASVEFVNLTVAGESVCEVAANGTCSPPPDTRISLPGGGEVILNEQVLEDPDPTDCTTQRAVTAVHVIPPGDGHETLLGQAESGAVYC